jgi:hypothetical protein
MVPMDSTDRKDSGFGGGLRRRLIMPLTVLAVLALSTMMCLSFGGSSTEGTDANQDVSATLEVLQQQLANAQATAAAAGQAAPATSAPAEPTQEAAAPRPGQMVEDSFDSDIGTFALGEGVQIQNGSLLLGPFDQCAGDAWAFDAPLDCNAVCLTCGSNLTNYNMAVDIGFSEGLSDKRFGVILRFVDENGDSMLDREDYLFLLGFDIYSNRWTSWVHLPDAVRPWYEVKAGTAGMRGQNNLNRLEVKSLNDGRMIDVFLNDKRLVKFTADAPQPGETLVKDWADSGAVGFLAIDRRVQARFDNFVLEPLP